MRLRKIHLSVPKNKENNPTFKRPSEADELQQCGWKKMLQ